MSEENQVDINIKTFNDLVEKGVPLQRDIKELRKDVVKSVNKCIKLRFDRKPNEFNQVVRGITSNKEDENPQFLRILTKVRNIVEYCQLMGCENEYQQYLSDLGLDIKLKYDPNDSFSSDNISSKNINKFNNEWANLFSQTPGDDPSEVMKKLYNITEDTNIKIKDISNHIKDDLGDQLKHTGIPKSALTRGIGLKLRAEEGKDIEENINKITEQAEMSAEAIRSLNS